MDDGTELDFAPPPDFEQALARNLTTRQRQAESNVERIYSRRQIETAFLETFELVGGIPRLALWANDPENYGLFLQLLLKLAPKEQMGRVAGQVLEYRSNIPPSPLSRTGHQSEEVIDAQPD